VLDVELGVVGEPARRRVDCRADRHRHDHGIEIGSELARLLESPQHLYERGRSGVQGRPVKTRAAVLAPGIAASPLELSPKGKRRNRPVTKSIRELVVSTGAMTNRLDKMERTGLVARRPDPSDRRGVLLELTEEGRQRLDDYVALAGRRKRELLSAALNDDEKRELNRLLRKLLAGLQAELGPAPKRRSSAAQLAESP
jgi:DNA-binding MarR family transcriptional regulator